ncbi:MAG: M81 family metallopeptidase [Chloroflexota bacterium]
MEGTVASARVLVGQFILEANSFAPGSTTVADFEPAGLYRGPELRRDRLTETNELTAAWDVLASAGVDLVPTIRAWAAARPPLDPAAWQEIRDSILFAADQSIDGVFLSLHGASLAHGQDDPEGDLLARLRDRLRPGVPIAISLDCHAGWTRAMEEGCDIATAYRTVPHVDMPRTGAQAARLLVGALRDEIAPVVRSAPLAMIAPADRQDDAHPLFAELMGLADQSEREPGILAAAFLPSHPWRDVPELGWAAIATADGDPTIASRVAGAIADAVWEQRRWFTGGSRLPVRDALRVALEGPPPVVIADVGDSPTGGAPGDSTELLRVALEHQDRSIWLAITDPTAAAQAQAAGTGARLAMHVGSGVRGAYNERVEVTAQVVAIPEGRVTYCGPYARGMTSDMGATALLSVGRIRIVVHSQQVMEIDPAPYLAAGLNPQEAEVLQAKSHVSYRAGYASVTDRSVVADTHGPTSANLPRMRYSRRPRPLFPFEDPGQRDPAPVATGRPPPAGPMRHGGPLQSERRHGVLD